MPASGPSGLQGSNYSDELKAAGLQAATPLIKNYDYSGAVGGPIRRDRLWFFTSARTQGNSQYVSNIFHNENAGNPNAWTYSPDTTRQAFRDRTWDNANIRLTSQITPRNKLNIFWDEQRTCRECENGGNNWGHSPEANSQGAAADHRQAGDVDLAREQQDSPRVRGQRVPRPLGRVQGQGGSLHRRPRSG